MEREWEKVGVDAEFPINPRKSISGTSRTAVTGVTYSKVAFLPPSSWR